ncbi:MAG: YceI family protein [Bryobacteraceae bacterium]
MIRLLASAALLAASAVSGATYQIDAGHSSAQFSVRHMMVSNVKGTFGNITGSIEWDPAQPETSKVTASIDVKTIDTRQAKRDADLRSEQFFDVAKYPAMTFASKSVSKAGGKILVKGDLTMHGVTREVTLTLDDPPAEIKDPRGGYRLGASASTRISRKEWGLTYSPVLEAGGVTIGDEVTITLDIEATRK